MYLHPIKHFQMVATFKTRVNMEVGWKLKFHHKMSNQVGLQQNKPKNAL